MAAIIGDVLGAVVGITGILLSDSNAKQANKIAQKQLDLGGESLNLQGQQAYLGAWNSVRDFEKSLTDLEGTKIQYGIDIRNTKSQIKSYDMWLENYSKQYAQEVQSKQAQTDALMASGKETYNNFMNAIGYSDALAGATGRVGAGTSQAHATIGIDQQLVEYVGADRKLDANGGLFGSQLTAANMEMEQLKVDLGFQKYEMEENRKIAQESIADWENALGLTQGSIDKSMKAKSDLEEFIDKNFKGYIPKAPEQIGEDPEAEGYRKDLANRL